MSEIKFACPHCAQHVTYVAGDSGDADSFIVCPSCGKPMPVPVTGGADSTLPSRQPGAIPPIPTLTPSAEKEREQHGAESPSGSVWQTRVGSILVLMLVPLLAAVLARQNGLPGGAVQLLGGLAGVACSGLAAWLAVRNIRGNSIMRWGAGVMVMMGLLAMQLGLLGCCA